ncbi:transposase [Synechocystis sp. PCC 7509]|uniref:transposase n=1 Tax=Synechocystis sp. PCC 7509 TaxID=927677 RepID=UPI0002AC2980|nr:transposase [Synechocystis sp. PCC 7509]
MALFPPGKGGGEEVAYGYKGKGILIHTLTDGNSMPLSSITTSANSSERQQIMPLIDRILVKNNQPGRPRKRVKVLAADKGYDAKNLRRALRKRGIRPELPKRVRKAKKNRGRPIKISVPRFQAWALLCLVSTQISPTRCSMGENLCLFQCFCFSGNNSYLN